MAVLLATLSGLLPDLDSASGVEMKGFTGILGVLAAVTVWDKMGTANPAPAFELHLWAMVIAFVVVRHGLRRFMTKIAVHRGISHSLPTCAVWAALAYLFYPTGKHDYPGDHILRLTMATAVTIGFLSHLLLDEICSVDLKGARVNKAFGTALKFWAPSPWTTLGMYAVLSYLTWKVVQVWPGEPFQWVAPPPPPIPQFTLPDWLFKPITLPGSKG